MGKGLGNDMRNPRQIFITAIEVILLLLFVLAIGKLLPTMLRIETNNKSQPLPVAQSTDAAYPPPATNTPTATATEAPYPPPGTETPAADTATPISTSTPEMTATLDVPIASTHTPIPLSTIAADAEGEIFYIDAEIREDTKLYKMDVDKEGKPKNKTKVNTEKELPYGVENFGIRSIYPSPDGKKVVILQNSEGPSGIILDIRSGKIEGPLCDFEYKYFFGWHPDSKHYLIGDTSGIYLIDKQGRSEVKIVSTGPGHGVIEGMVISAAASPDGTQFVYSYYNNTEYRSEVWVIQADSQSATKLFTSSGGPVFQLAWSPDGTKIAYWDGGYYMVMDADGSNSRQLVELPPAGERPPLWSPDSQMLLVDVNGREGSAFEDSNIYIVDVNSGEAKTILPDKSTGHYYSAWSPDGKKIVFISTLSGKPDLWVINRDRSNLKQITQDRHNIHFVFWRKQK